MSELANVSPDVFAGSHSCYDVRCQPERLLQATARLALKLFCMLATRAMKCVEWLRKARALTKQATKYL